MADESEKVVQRKRSSQRKRSVTPEGSTLFPGFEDHAMIDITTLSREEQLQLLEKLWDSLSSTPEAIPLTDMQREELDRRLDELDREGPVGIPAEDVLGRRPNSRGGNPALYAGG